MISFYLPFTETSLDRLAWGNKADTYAMAVEPKNDLGLRASQDCGRTSMSARAKSLFYHTISRDSTSLHFKSLTEILMGLQPRFLLSWGFHQEYWVQRLG